MEINKITETNKTETDKGIAETIKTETDKGIAETTRTDKEINEISINALEKFIENAILKTDNNLQYIPDVLEKKIYLTVCKTIMKSLEIMCNTTNIELMGHKITFNINPLN